MIYNKFRNVLRKKQILTMNVSFNFNIETPSKKKWNALIWASCSNHLKMVKLLISKGAAAQYL